VWTSFPVACTSPGVEYVPNVLGCTSIISHPCW
jgi:hypothetical protein